MRKSVSVCYVLPAGDDPGRIVGYYSLSNSSIELEGLPEDFRKRLPKYPAVPATLLGRLAVDERERGKDFGEFLLMDALKRSLRTSYIVGSAAVVVDPKNDSVGFYEKYGFLHFQSSDRLFLPMATIETLFPPASA